MGVQGDRGSKSHGGEDDSTRLRTQTTTNTPRTRCVPPEALKNAGTAKRKALKRGAARFPVLVSTRPFTGCHAGLAWRLPCRPFKIFVFVLVLVVFVLDFSFFCFLARASVGTASAETRRTKMGAGKTESRAMRDKSAVRQSFLTTILHHYL